MEGLDLQGQPALVDMPDMPRALPTTQALRSRCTVHLNGASHGLSPALPCRQGVCTQGTARSRDLTFPSSSLPSRALIHVTACIWGSMHSGQRAARVVSSPFCMLSSSPGSPSLAQAVVSTSSVMMASSLKGCVTGTFLVSRSDCHSSYTIWQRYF